MKGKLGELIYRGMHVNLTCKSWGCPVCAKRKMAELIQRLWEGGLYALASELLLEGFKYGTKMLTLTLPGAQYRSQHTFDEMVDDLQANFHRLMAALRKRYGGFHYFWVIELQKDGTPHMHVILCGRSITPRSLLPAIKNLWCVRYRMGFVKLRATRQVYDPRSGHYIKVKMEHPQDVVRYMVKYMAKGLGWVGSGRRLFGASKGALAAEVCLKHEFLVFMQVSGYTIQEEMSAHGETFLDDSRQMFLVRGKAALREEMEKHFDMTAKIFRGRLAQEEWKRLNQEFPGEELPNKKLIKH